MKAKKGKYPCNVGGCGGGKCVHDWAPYACPHCGNQMVRVNHSGHMFCSNHESLCDYDGHESDIIKELKPLAE